MKQALDPVHRVWLLVSALQNLLQLLAHMDDWLTAHGTAAAHSTSIALAPQQSGRTLRLVVSAAPLLPT